MNKTYYIIKKSNKLNRTYAIYSSISLSIFCLVFGFLMFFPLIEIDQFDEADFIAYIFFFFLFEIYGIYYFIQSIKTKNAKNLKDNGQGMIIKAKVKSVQKTKLLSRNHTVNVYYLIAEDSGAEYYSIGYNKGVLGGALPSDLYLIYMKYGYTYDEHQSQKSEVLRKIEELKSENENKSFIYKLFFKNKFNNLEKDRKAIEEGFIHPYWEINGKRISVGDTVDVYINPDKPNMYWVDIDSKFDLN